MQVIAMNSKDGDQQASALRKIAENVSVYLATEHDEHYELALVERAINVWFAREVEDLLSDGVELLTAPHHGRAFRFRQQLKGMSKRKVLVPQNELLRHAA